MGNCVAGCKVVSESEAETTEEARRRVAVPTKLDTKAKNVEGGKRKTVRFKLAEAETDTNRYRNGQSEPKRGVVVRIKVVLTREELEQMLNYGVDVKHSSTEELIRALRLRARGIHEVRGSEEGSINGSWKPALESIPEDH